MKRNKSFLTVVMAAVFALSLVPVQALAASGQMYGDQGVANGTDTAGEGSITIINTVANETYDVYRIFDLASFSDPDTAQGHHNAILVNGDSTDADPEQDEAYSYVIRQYKDDLTSQHTAHDANCVNPWWTFLTTYGQGGTASATPYMIPTTESNSDKTAKAFFTYEPAAITLVDAEGHEHKDYHVVKATVKFSNEWDAFTGEERHTGTWTDNGGTEQTEDLGTGTFNYKDQDYVDPGSDRPSVKVVQDFAQEALKYARTLGGNGKPTIAPNYKETATGTSVVVNTSANGTPENAKYGEDNNGKQKVPLGWYLMGTTTGTLAALDTANASVTAYDKNLAPDIDKKVLKKGSILDGGTEYMDLTISALEDNVTKATAELAEYTTSNPGATAGDGEFDRLTTAKSNAEQALEDARDYASLWVANTDADIEDFVQFRTVITARQGAKDYVLHDVMEKGLTFVNEASVANTADDRYVTARSDDNRDHKLQVYLVRGDQVWFVHGNETGSNFYQNYVLVSDTDPQEDGCDFEVKFKDANAENDTADSSSLNKVAFQAIAVDAAGTWKTKLTNPTTFTMVDLKDGDRIVVTYWAKLDGDAVVYGDEENLSAEQIAALNTVGEGQSATVSKTSVKDNRAAADAEELVEADGSTKTVQKYTVTDGNNRNTNSTILVYGERAHTAWKSADVTTYQLDVAKTEAVNTDGVGDGNYKMLPGAKFSLYKAKEVTGIAEGTLSTPDYVPNGIMYVPSTGASDFKGLVGANSAGVKGYYATSKALLFNREDTPDDDTTQSVDESATHSIYQYLGEVATDAALTSGTHTTVLESLAGEEINAHGLEEGWYMLVEDKAPDGYNKLAYPIMVYVHGDVNPSGTLDYDGVDRYDSNGVASASGDRTVEGMLDVWARSNDNDGALVPATRNQNVTGEWDSKVTTTNGKSYYTKYGNGGIHVINQTGAELPSTGGIGTTIFYVAGTVLVVGAAVMLVAKRRMGSEA